MSGLLLFFGRSVHVGVPQLRPKNQRQSHPQYRSSRKWGQDYWLWVTQIFCFQLVSIKNGCLFHFWVVMSLRTYEFRKHNFTRITFNWVWSWTCTTHLWRLVPFLSLSFPFHGPPDDILGHRRILPVYNSRRRVTRGNRWSGKYSVCKSWYRFWTGLDLKISKRSFWIVSLCSSIKTSRIT